MDTHEWTRALCDRLGIDPAEVDVGLLLDQARDAAHAVERPAAPVTTYVLGLAVGRGADPAAVHRMLAQALAALPGAG